MLAIFVGGSIGIDHSYVFQCVRLHKGCAQNYPQNGSNFIFVYIDQIGAKFSWLYADYGGQVVEYWKWRKIQLRTTYKGCLGNI